MIQHHYPEHFYEPIRRQIAEEYIQHELRKFFGTVNDLETWKRMDQEIQTWFEGHNTFAPVRDFWNGLHAISRGFKLKNIVTWLTSEHIHWNKQEIDLSDLHFGVSFPEFAHLGTKNVSVQKVQDFFRNLSEKEQQEIRESNMQKFSHANPVNDFPIIVVEREQVLVVVDGNRRTFQALLTGKTSIATALGKQTAVPVLHNYWVPTSLLYDLVAEHRLHSEENDSLTEAIAVTIASMIQSSKAGQYELFEKIASEHQHPADVLLIHTVAKKL